MTDQVYVVTSKTGGIETYHTDEDCTHLNNTKYKRVPMDSLYDDTKLCSRCDGQKQPNGDKDFTYFKALKNGGK